MPEFTVLPVRSGDASVRWNVAGRLASKSASELNVNVPNRLNA